MRTQTDLLSYFQGLKMNVTESDIKRAIQNSTTNFIWYADKLNKDPLDATLYRAPELPFKDFSVSLYQGTDEATVVSSANLKDYTEFDVDFPPFPVFAAEFYQVDYAQGTIRLAVALPTNEFMALRVSVVDVEAVTNNLLGMLAISNRAESARRGNISIGQRSYGQVLTDRNNVAATAGSTIIEGTFTRVTHGVIRGVNAQGEIVD